MKNRTEGEIILARCHALNCMKIQGIVQKHQVLNNKVSAAYHTEIRETHMTSQLVLPENRHRNLADQAIQTWKNHLVGVLSGLDETFLLHLWCQAILQAKQQLLLLQKSRLNPKISAYAHTY